MDEIKIGVVGLGFGQYHVNTLANMPEFKLVAMADLAAEFPGGFEAYAARYGANAYRDAQDMFENEELDAVSICTSPRYRQPIIEAAARKGLAMFIEKPWGTNLTHSCQLAEICQEHNATVMVGFSFRFHPVVVRMRTLLDNELGSPWMLNGEYLFDWVPPSDHWLWDKDNGNGFFNENSCHLFDIVCHLLGKPISLSAEGISPNVRPSAEGAVISMNFASGAIASLMVGGIGTGGYNRYPRLNLVAAEGQAEMRGHEHYWDELTWVVRGGSNAKTINTPPESLQNTRYSHAFRHFAECIQTGRQPEATIEDGIVSVAIAEAIYQSLHTGQKISIITNKEAAHAFRN